MTSTLVHTTSTPTTRQHGIVVEMEHDDGFRLWSVTMPESKVDAYIDSFTDSWSVSDIDCSSNCHCKVGG